MKYKLFIWILVISIVANASMGLTNYFEINGFDTGSIPTNFTANVTLNVTLPTNATFVNATITLKGYLDSNYSLQQLVSENYTCTGDWSVAHDCDDAADGNYATYGQVNVPNMTAYVYYNFSVQPSRVMLLDVKLYNYDENLTVTNCSLTDNTLQVRGVSWHNDSTGVDSDGVLKMGAYVQCRNGSTWAMLYNNSFDVGTGRGRIYNVGLFSRTYPENVVVKVNDTVVFNNTGELIGTNETIELNHTRINSFILSTAKLPVRIESVFGVLELRNLSMFYEDLWECDGRAGEHPSYNFSIFDEDNFTRLTGDIWVDLTYLDNELSFGTDNIHSLALCMGGSTNYTVSGTVYNEVEYVHKHFLAEAVFTPTLQHVRIYNFPDGMTGLSTLQFIVRDYSYTAYPTIITRMQRYYPENHTWLVVQQDQSGEFGSTVFQVYESDVDYKFYFYSGATLLDNTDSVKFVCDEFDICYVEYAVILGPTVPRDIRPAYTYDNDTKIVTVTWNDPTGATSAVEISVYKTQSPDNIKICNTTISSASGSYTCDVTGYAGSGMVIIRSQGSPWTGERVWPINFLGLPQLWNVVPGKESYLWSFGLSLVIAAMGATGTPIAVIIMTVISIWIQFLLGLTSIVSIAFVTGALILGIGLSMFSKK